MKKSLGIFTTWIVLGTAASAQEPAQTVQTSGTGELRRVSEAMITPGSGSISISLPATVNKGEVISIQYQSAGNAVADSFMVTRITVTNDVCAIESERQTPTGAAPSDMIRARPCKKLK